MWGWGGNFANRTRLAPWALGPVGYRLPPSTARYTPYRGPTRNARHAFSLPIELPSDAPATIRHASRSAPATAVLQRQQDGTLWLPMFQLQLRALASAPCCSRSLHSTRSGGGDQLWQRRLSATFTTAPQRFAALAVAWEAQVRGILAFEKKADDSCCTFIVVFTVAGLADLDDGAPMRLRQAPHGFTKFVQRKLLQIRTWIRRGQAVCVHRRYRRNDRQAFIHGLFLSRILDRQTIVQRVIVLLHPKCPPDRQCGMANPPAPVNLFSPGRPAASTQ